MKKPSRRSVLGHATAVLGAAVLTPGASSAAAPSTKPSVGAITPAPIKPASPKREPPKVAWVPLQQTGWNTYATRYVDAPLWTWQPMEGATAYIVQFAHADDREARTIRLAKPEYEMGKEWPSLANGRIDIVAWAVDAQDQVLTTMWRKQFWKCPGFDGVRQEPLDYRASVDRNLAYLLAPARDEVQEYERGLPRSIWSATEDNITGKRRILGFPALHHPSFVFAFLGYADRYPDGAHAAEAVRQAKQYGDWLLANRLPADWKCGLFPFSTIQNGKPEGLVEGRNITLFRAARVGEAMVALFRRFKESAYLDYAHHLAAAYVKLQRADGSWPYRVDPTDGRVVEDYTSNAVTPARLLGMLEDIEANRTYAAAREKAAKWVMENPVRNRRWQGMYEDIGATAPYRNLEHWDTNEMIRYLVRYHRDDAERVGVAEGLNRYIEDQFIVWAEGDPSTGDYCPAPTALEQYTCYRPMEVHTGMWLMSLLALHRATGKADYLVKAINAGNAIVKAQQPTGAYSTWGFDSRFEKPLLTLDWPGCNAVAAAALVELGRYLESPERARKAEQTL